MSRIIYVSNLLPIKILKNNNEITYIPRIGGFASGLKEFYKSHSSLWMGWTGLEKRGISLADKEVISKALKNKNCYPIYLRKREREMYLDGFSNRTIWPLFHYYTGKSFFREDTWNYYVKVNHRYAEELEKIIREGDQIWIHDYHLMLLPSLLRERFPDLSIGYFQHIPFPSFEIFRLLPWRKQILEGLLGADLIGFHTYDYERHFISSIRRIMGLETYFNQIRYGKRVLKVENFPMGIDYEKFHGKAVELMEKTPKGLVSFRDQIERHVRVKKENKIILIVDRLDYTKGIINRLNAYMSFLDNYPEFKEKVSLLLYVTALRENDTENREIKKELDSKVGRINSEYGRIDWTPVHYFNEQLEFDKLVQVMVSSDVAMMSPLRDGMNLIAKEYIASKPDHKGVLIISEMAGASKELGEAIIVNPHNPSELSAAIHTALSMPEEEMVRRNKILQKRLSTYTQSKWASDFINGLNSVKKIQEYNLTRKISDLISRAILERYNHSEKRMIFLDYDGTLQGFFKDPQNARPDAELYSVVKALISDQQNNVVIISGRDKETLSTWFDEKWRLGFIAEHGVWTKDPGEEWRMLDQIDKGWMEIIRPTIDFYVDRTPGSFIEEKNYSIVWHYRDADPDLGMQRSLELKDELQSLVTNLNLEIMDGDKVIEIKNSGINKGRAALARLGEIEYDFIMAMGDDWTDEFTFEALPEDAITIKVGDKSTRAKYYVESYKEIRNFLKLLIQ